MLLVILDIKAKLEVQVNGDSMDIQVELVELEELEPPVTLDELGTQEELDP